MTDTDRAQFATALAALGEVFDVQVSKAKAEAYFASLRDQPVEVVVGAVQTAMRTCRFFPRPAELLDLIHGDLEDRAAFQWTQAVLHTKGRPSELDESGEATVALMGGWREIDWVNFKACAAVEEATIRKQFMQLYRVAAKRGETRYALPGGYGPRALSEPASGEAL